MWEFFGVRRGLPTLVIVIGAAAALAMAWRFKRHAPASATGEATIAAPADARRALIDATAALARAPGDATASWDRAVALQRLGLVHVAADGFEMIAAHGVGGRAAEARVRARAIRDEERKREETRRAVEAAGREMVNSGLVPAPELVRAYPRLIETYLEKALIALKNRQQLAQLVPVAEKVDSNGDADLATRVRAAAGLGPPSARHEPEYAGELAFGLLLEQAQGALRAGDGAGAEKQALGGFANSRGNGFDPTNLPRRFLLLAADAARAQHEDALANAYVGEARQLMP